jgi:ElaB/YqjD/DUF883 family membrane-anchored ribosome-binding protein
MKTQQALSGAALTAATLGADTTDVTYHASEATRRASHDQEGALATVTRYISENPWYAATIGIGAGILLGLLLPKPRS